MGGQERGGGALGNLRGILESLRRNLLGAFGIMMIALTIGNALNYLFNIVMTRMLPEEGAFGEFFSLSALFLIVTLGALTVQTVITKYIAEFEALDQRDRSRALIRSFSRWLIYVGIAVMVVSIASAWPLADVLKLDSPLYVIILGSSVALALYITVPMGLLQGQQRFIGLGTATMSVAALRMVFGVVLVVIGLGVYGALGAATLAYIVIALIVIYYCRDMFTKPEESLEDFHPVSALRYLIPVAAATFLVILLTQIDVVLVKALFSRTDADAYSYGALAGKAVLFFPEGITLVMFPRVSELKAKGEPTRRVLALSVAAVTAMVGVVAGFFALFPSFTAWFFAGEKGKEALTDITGVFGLNFIVVFGIVMAVFAIVKLLVYYQLALEKKAFIILFVLAGVIQIAGIILFHNNSLANVLSIMLLVSLLLLVSNLFLAWYGKPADKQEEVFRNESELSNNK